jgi:release factor glutamine methyltransferase
MTVGQALRPAADQLVASGFSSGYLDAILLLAFVRQTSKTKLLASLPEPIAADTLDHFQHLLSRRLQGEPMAYILGHKEFYGLEFAVGPGVLIPRPETELLVDWVLETFDNQPAIRLRDIGTGSGCIPICLQQHRPNWTIHGSDIDPAALAWAKKNALALAQPAIGWIVANGLADVEPGGYQVITANPPYVPTAEARIGATTWLESLTALDGGPDGLTVIRRLAVEAWTVLPKAGSLFLEIGDGQGPAVLDWLRQTGFGNCQIRTDLAGMGRIVRGTKL